MQIKIKKAIKDCLSDIYDISREQFKNESWSLCQLEECTQKKAYITYVLIADGETASFLIAQNLVDSINLLLVATKNEFKRNGFATLLVKKLIKESKKREIKTWLEVKSTNPATEFYKNLGFKLLYERKNYYKDGCSALVMEKEN